MDVPGTAWYRPMWCEDIISHANNGKKKKTTLIHVSLTNTWRD